MDGERLKSLRVEKGMSQTELGELVGTGKHSISMWEHNKNEPDDETKIILAKHFGISLDYLLGLSDERNPSVYKVGQRIELYLPPEFPKEALEQLKTFYEFLVEKYKQG